MLSRRSMLVGVGAAAVSRLASAQGFPGRTVTIIVPYPPGGPIDQPVAVKTPAEMAAMLPGESAKRTVVINTAHVAVD